MAPKGSLAVGKKAKTGAPAGAASASSKTTFQDVIMAVPDLALACARRLDHRMLGTGGGLKELRRVSKVVKEAAQAAVQGFTLKLGHKATAITPNLTVFLNTSGLAHLRITISSIEAAMGDTGGVATSDIAAQLVAFIKSASTALGRITHLTVTLPPATGFDEKETTVTKASTAMLLPLAAACPKLQQLTLSGRVGSSILKQFGASCPELACLDVCLTNLSPSTLKQLPKLLPRLTSLALLPAPTPPKQKKGSKLEAVDEGTAICLVLKSCPRLLTFNTGTCTITKEIWDALPADLPTLVCRPPSDVPDEAWKQHTNMHRLEFSHERLNIAVLVALLAAAPCLGACHMRDGAMMSVVLSRADARDLKTLDRRIDAGMAMSGMQKAWDREAGLSKLALFFKVHSGKRHIVNVADEDYEHTMPVFLTSHMQPLNHVAEVYFSNEDAPVQAGDLFDLPRLLPAIEHLTVDNLTLAGTDMQALIGCTKLKEMILMTVDGVDGRALRFLCAKSRSLRKAQLCGCRGITVAEEKAIKAGDPWYGTLGAVRVNIERGDYLEEEDYKFEQRQMWSNDDDSNSNSDDNSY